MYTAYVLTDAARSQLEAKFPPKYPKFIGHHVTEAFGVPADTVSPEPAIIRVIGSKDSGDGLEALVVTVNGLRKRPDGNPYHITWSLDPEKYTPKDSNDLIKNSHSFTLSLPVSVETVPEVLK